MGAACAAYAGPESKKKSLRSAQSWTTPSWTISGCGDIFTSKVRTGVGVDDEYDEEEDLPEPPPRQELINPGNIIDIPDPSEDDDGEFILDIPDQVAEPLKNWREALEGLAYPSETVTITDQEISGVERTELTPEGWTIREEGPTYDADSDVDLDPEQLADGIKQELLGMAESLLDHAGHSSQFKGRIYGILLGHMRIKFLDGASMGLAEGHHLEAARRMLPQVEEKIKSIPGLIEGMVKYGDK